MRETGNGSQTELPCQRNRPHFDGVWKKVLKIVPRWSVSNTNVHTSDPNSGNEYLGNFGNQTIEYTATGLGNHDNILVGFDVYIINSMDGNVPLSMYVDGEEIVTHYFNTWNPSEGNIFFHSGNNSLSI